MDAKNDSRGGREDRLSETHILQVDAPMSDSCHSERDLSHERQVTLSSSIERPHGDAGLGEFVLGGCRGGELRCATGKRGRYVGERVETFLTNQHHNRHYRRL